MSFQVVSLALFILNFLSRKSLMLQKSLGLRPFCFCFV